MHEASVQAPVFLPDPPGLPPTRLTDDASPDARAKYLAAYREYYERCGAAQAWLMGRIEQLRLFSTNDADLRIVQYRFRHAQLVPQWSSVLKFLRGSSRTVPQPEVPYILVMFQEDRLQQADAEIAPTRYYRFYMNGQAEVWHSADKDQPERREPLATWAEATQHLTLDLLRRGRVQLDLLKHELERLESLG